MWNYSTLKHRLIEHKLTASVLRPPHVLALGGHFDRVDSRGIGLAFYEIAKWPSTATFTLMDIFTRQHTSIHVGATFTPAVAHYSSRVSCGFPSCTTLTNGLTVDEHGGSTGGVEDARCSLVGTSSDRLHYWSDSMHSALTASLLRPNRRGVLPR